MDHRKNLALFHVIAELLQNHDTDRRVYDVLLALPAGSENGCRNTDLRAIYRRHDARCFRSHFGRSNRTRKQRNIIRDARIAALRRNYCPEYAERGSGVDRGLRAASLHPRSARKHSTGPGSPRTTPHTAP